MRRTLGIVFLLSTFAFACHDRTATGAGSASQGAGSSAPNESAGSIDEPQPPPPGPNSLDQNYCSMRQLADHRLR